MINTPSDLIPYFLILALFIGGTWYHVRIYQSNLFFAKLSKSMKLVLILIPVILIGMAFVVGDKSLFNFLLSIAASIFLMSRPMAEGVSEKGIYYISTGGGMLLRLAKWEDIRDIKIDSDKNKLKSFTYKKRRAYPSQSYRPQEFEEIMRLILTRTDEDYLNE